MAGHRGCWKLLARAGLLACLALLSLAGLGKAAEPLRVQLIWRNQAQFAGFYAAEVKGYYKREGLTVSLIEGGPGISPLQRLADGEADVAVARLAAALEARRRGLDLVNIAQILQGSSMALACRNDAGVETAADLGGKRIGVWMVGDEVSVRHLLRNKGIAPDSVTLVPQAPDGRDLLSGQVACATIMLYNEYWSLVAGGLGPAELLLIPFGTENVGFLEDGLYVRRESLRDPAQADRLRRFLAATAQGWRYADEHREDTLAMIQELAPGLNPLRQQRMLDSVLTSIGEGPFGLLDLDDFHRSIDVLASDSDDPATLRDDADDSWTHEVWRAAGLDPQGQRPLTRATAYNLQQAMVTHWFSVLDIIGTIAFALSGFMRAQQRHYDLWGATILAMLPAIAGGTLRDLLIGGDRLPLFIFRDPLYIQLVLGVVVVGTLVGRLLPSRIGQTVGFDRWMTLFDTIGLATFTVVGAKVALVAGLSWYWVAFFAGLTCAGGGMLLDVITGREPRTFQGEPYEEIAVGGGLFLYLGLLIANRYEHAPWIITALILATLVLVFATRLLLLRFNIRSYRLGSRRPQAPPV